VRGSVVGFSAISISLAITSPNAVIVDPGGTNGKLQTPVLKADQWSYGEPHLSASTRELTVGDELLINDHRVVIRARSDALPRYPPRPLLYTTCSNCGRILLAARHRLTFVLATAAPGVSPRQLAARIRARTGLKARSSDDFKADTSAGFSLTRKMLAISRRCSR
jgi:putative ABC transport system permease protein